jgi:PIN like domain
MRSSFPAFFLNDPENMDIIWRDCIFVFDANTLLNFYRYSESSRLEFLNTLIKLQDRIWLPEQAAREFLRNRHGVILAQANSYDDSVKKITQLLDVLSKDLSHPFVSNDAMQKLTDVSDTVLSELTSNKEKLNSRLSIDNIKDEIASAFENRVGEKFDSARLESIFIEGKERFSNRTPPGYADDRKSQDPKSDSEKRTVYGDLIIWKQIIFKATQVSKPVVFITDDAKTDWWLEIQGKTIGPRPELVEEFILETSQMFHMYSSERFLEYVKNAEIFEISKSTIDEVREIDGMRSTSYENSFPGQIGFSTSEKDSSALRNWAAHNSSHLSKDISSNAELTQGRPEQFVSSDVGVTTMEELRNLYRTRNSIIGQLDYLKK